MTKKLIIPLLLVAIGASVLSTAICYFLISDKQRYAFIDVIRLTQGYQLKKDLEKEAQVRLQGAKNQLDSLRFQAGMANANTTEGQQMQRMYMEAEYRYTQQQQQVDQQLSTQVWERLNPLINKFSKEKNLKMLVGATGTGSLLYGDSSLDLTDELIKYVNQGYGH